jgi:hypothetical protein
MAQHVHWGEFRGAETPIKKRNQSTESLLNDGAKLHACASRGKNLQNAVLPA